MKGKLKWILSLALLAALLAGAVNLPLPGLSPAARAEDGFNILDGILVGYTGPGGIVRIPRGVWMIENEVFLKRSDITGVVIPDTVTVIGKKVFQGCTGLKVVAVPNTVKTIGEAAFAGCTGLKKVTLPKGLKKIGEDTFSGCTSLKKVTLPKGVTEIGAYAFIGCRSLTKITLPKGLKRIGTTAFGRCTSLASIAIPDTVDVIDDYAFSYSGLKEVTLPKSITTIGFEVFYECDTLASVTIQEGVTEIGESAFESCTGLTNIVIPGSVTSIGHCAFKGCTSLASIVIPSSVTTIGSAAFKRCTGLTSVVIPDSVSDIAADAFDYCPNLRFVTLPSEAQAPVFDGSAPVTTVIPDNLLPPAVFLREGQRMVLPKFKGAEVEWSVAGEPVAEIINNNAVRGVARGNSILRMTVAQAAQGKALTLNGQPLKPGKAYDIGLKVFATEAVTAGKVAVNGPRRLTLHPLGLEYGYPAAAKLDLVLAPASLPGFWKEYCFYISSNPSVAGVLGDGTIVAVKPGKAVITAYTPNMKSAKVRVTVKGWVTSLRLMDSSGAPVKRLTLGVEEDCLLTPEFNWDAALKEVRWTSSNPRVAAVFWDGEVFARSRGTARITATALDGSNKKATAVVTVIDVL